MSQRKVILLLGSNIKNPKKNIEEAISLIEKRLGKVIKKSQMLETEPVEFASSNIFCNIAVLLEAQISPIRILDEVKSIEKAMGRISDSKELGGYEDRVIDIDVVSIGNITYKSRRLDIPHYKHVHERDFSQVLLREIGITK
ncbi:2-amino-4-hydroxy-6-hydroxymethyldihydropteridine diphosphokinase [Riemerella anatipestifer]|uniref:2-amino-4-hydroxy-6-hydroxymethyldihydropteridine pyrophosphokinase n=1 Tax=Riemerella anatipestifer TaxID=34085 RepID=A0AAP3AN27_RIEAN|nr:2-amino-4-hydroxy-6-hydroxymethyldihydropteridine diphosphokinase [Riemerella anatipestifer]AZZ58292.1 2-amino-4-hydroxy-6-hydroxymethyldihydropteridine diphosphokinase [Riemerella anatipestifer]MBT0552095.1 2-amino-4-hydroxy-6-hydroxymethyldihydropteridine diphosphokinase [Riemerella anatipestifer]MBT0554318.1 2-amino-4-hydroxy-6-hydroxymethyldihydropteridine diphosphokinase [Riemerella anatipestifer]MBT0573029.1 2-amino-4-hydroxy-6-hydroxymethyldihydropteridine diphosphokinase [Riemerella 